MKNIQFLIFRPKKLWRHVFLTLSVILTFSCKPHENYEISSSLSEFKKQNPFYNWDELLDSCHGQTDIPKNSVIDNRDIIFNLLFRGQLYIENEKSDHQRAYIVVIPNITKKIGILLSQDHARITSWKIDGNIVCHGTDYSGFLFIKPENDNQVK